MQIDVLIVGAGPAGMSAACELADSGAKVRMVDEQPAPGGQVYRSIERVRAERPAQFRALGGDYARGLDLVQRFRRSPVEVNWETSAWDIAGGAAPRIALAGATGARELHPRHILLTLGAMERATPFPGWTLPGVVNVGAAQTLMKESALLPAGRVVIAGSGPLVLLYATQLLAAGIHIDCLLDTGPANAGPAHWPALALALPGNAGALFKGLTWQRRLKRAGIRRLAGVTALRAIGKQRVEAVEYVHNGRAGHLATDLLLVHDGVIPNAHLAMAAGCEHRWQPLQRCWAPVTDADGASDQPGIWVAGDGAGIGGAEAAVSAGRLSGRRLAATLGFLDKGVLEAMNQADRRRLARLARLRRFLDGLYRPLGSFQVPPEDDTVVCRCEEVTAGEIRRVAAMGCMGPNQGKAFTRCGMGPCMGRKCGNTVSQILADFHQLPVSEIGHYRIRPPVRPITIGQLADMEQAAVDATHR